jgi:hypothetical protein
MFGLSAAQAKILAWIRHLMVNFDVQFILLGANLLTTSVFTQINQYTMLHFSECERLTLLLMGVFTTLKVLL